MRKILSIFLVILPLLSVAQFAPPAGQEGTTAMHADSSAFVGWATGIVVEHGPVNITNPSAGMTGGSPFVDENALGFPDGTMGVVCLGDGGRATLTFDSPIYNGLGPDFAVFENGMENAAQPGAFFLELGFVEVSSDGENFFRFPAVSNVPTETQLGGFDCIDPRLIHNLASKYIAMYGTPFDLDEVEDNPLLDKNKITHVRIIDVVGNIDPEYATYDSEGHAVNDPWPTPFNSCGFDLDAVGVIHDLKHYGVAEPSIEILTVYPNPAHDMLKVKAENVLNMSVYTMTGQQMLWADGSSIDVSMLPNGIYMVRVVTEGKTMVEKFIKN